METALLPGKWAGAQLQASPRLAPVPVARESPGVESRAQSGVSRHRHLVQRDTDSVLRIAPRIWVGDWDFTLVTGPASLAHLPGKASLWFLDPWLSALSVETCSSP